MTTSTRPLHLEPEPGHRERRRPCCADVMRVVHDRLAALAETGRGSTIDLSRWNLPAVEYRRLRLALAPGRLSGVTAAPRRRELHATIYPGVWWITRYRAQEAATDKAISVAFATEAIEISAAPDMLGGTSGAPRRRPARTPASSSGPLTHR